jgi:hypothetical protein
LRQIVYFLGKYNDLANFPAWNSGAAVAALPQNWRITGRFLTATRLFLTMQVFCLPNNLESAVFVFHMKPVT